jgi:energy-dependent translational throttle protein EttA
LRDVRKVVGTDRIILDGVTLSFLHGAKIGVVGPNGTGKSSLLRILAGVDPDYLGEARPAPGIKIGFLSQEPQLDPAKDVLGNVEEGLAEIRDLLHRFEAVSARFAEELSDDEMNALIDEQGKLQDHIDAVGGWELERKLEIAMDALRCPPGDAKVETLSGGERRRVALCRLLLQAPDLLLLDEPTNHLDAESVAWLERHLQEYKGTVIAVTHDRYFLDNVAEWILELDRGGYYPFKGNYSSWLEQKQERLDVDDKKASARKRTLARELEWVRMSPRARQAKSKARLQAYEELRAEEEARLPETIEITIPPGPRLGDVVIEAEHLSKAFGERLLIDDLSFRLPPGGIVGVIGPNGAGKTTLFKMLVGEEKPDAGTLKLGDTVKLAYVDQSRDALDGTKNVWNEISGGEDILKLGRREVPSRAYVSSFGFKGPEQQKLVSALSGGERNRLHLAKLLKSGGNVLLLDEPTNDLDVDTLRALEDALLGFSGCIVVISHDRWFLDRIATHILAFEGESHVEWFEGNFEDYEADRKRRLGADADQPHRLHYKKIAH